MDSKGQFKENLNNDNTDDATSLIKVSEHSTPFEHSAPAVVNTSHLKRDALEKRHLIAYAIGHFSNDLCAAQWFFYLVYYLKFIVGLTGGQAGYAMMSGQFADGLMTPLVGALSDRYKTRIGSRTPWYIFGTFIVLPSFFALFLGPFDRLY
jgi:glycoside/pentoside/hexuronide:cation symporter, GPH family